MGLYLKIHYVLVSERQVKTTSMTNKHLRKTFALNYKRSSTDARNGYFVSPDFP